MAGKGKPVGTIFAELDLDSSKYTQAQKQILKGALEAAGNIETNWKRIGSQSDTMFDAMRRNAQNAYDAIAKNAHSTASEISRAQEALNSRLKSIDVKQYGLPEPSFLSKVKDGVFDVKNAIAAMAGAAVVWKGVQFAKDLVESGMAAERLRNSMAASLGGYNKAESAMSYLRDQAKGLGTDLYTGAEAFQKLAASAKGTTLEGEKTRDIFTAITTASSALHLSNEQTSGALLAISQMMSKGTVQAEELRGQLGERLPGAFNIAARAMGVTTAELGKMLEQGQVIAADFLPKFARALNEDYAGAATNSAESTQAAVNRMKTSWEEAKRDIGEILLPAVKTAANKINALIQAIAPEHLSDANKVIALQEKVANLKDRMTQPGMTWVLGDDLKRAESELSRLEDKMAGINRSAGNWAVGVRSLQKAESDLFSKGDSWQSYYKEREKAYDRGAKDVTAYYVALDKAAEKANKAADADRNYFKTIMDLAQYLPDATSDIAEHARQMQREAEISKAYYYKLERETMRAGYQSDMFQGMPAANKRAEEMLKAAEKDSGYLVSLSENTAKQMEKNFSSFYFDTITGKLSSLEDFWTSVLNSLAKMTSDILGQMTREMIFGVKSGETSLYSQIFNGLGDLFTSSAQGNVFSGPGIGAYSNSIVSKPTVFPFARGIGLMGEAGSEAIMPLTRTRSGDLGVKTTGASAPAVKIEVNNHGMPQSYEQKDMRFDGDAWVISVVAKDMMTDKYGLRTLMGAR